MPLSQLVDKTFLKTTPFNIVLDKFKSLGIVVTSNLGQLLENNWDKKMKQLEKNIDFRNTLPISMFGRINAIKMVALPRF